jgi:Na+/proline symporter
MAPLDYLIVLVYLVILAVIGIALARRAGQSGEHYFLGGRAMPWWALGASGMSSNLDVAGTMTLVALLHLYGLQGFFIEMRGGVVLPIAVFLAFMGKWHRRSEVMTTAEWMLLRFGDGAQGRAARLMAALTYLVITVAMTVFFFTASGRFLAELVPFTPLQCTLGMAVVALGYTLAGGLYGHVPGRHHRRGGDLRRRGGVGLDHARAARGLAGLGVEQSLAARGRRSRAGAL